MNVPLRRTIPRAYCGLLPACVNGKPAGETATSISLRRAALFWGRNWLSERGFKGKKILALAPGSGAREKNWPGRFFREVERWWRESGGESFVIFGPAEEEWFEEYDWRGAKSPAIWTGKVARCFRCAIYLGTTAGSRNWPRPSASIPRISVRRSNNGAARQARSVVTATSNLAVHSSGLKSCRTANV